MKIALISLLCITVMCGCAQTPEEAANRVDNARKHILRVSNHGYLIKDETGFTDTADQHLTTKETADKYADMLTGALELACENSEMLDTKEQKDKCKKISGELMLNVARCSTTPAIDVCSDALFEQFEQYFVESATPIKLLFYFHGGLNKYQDTDERVASQVDFIKKGQARAINYQEPNNIDTLPYTQHWQYPIFVSWSSSALDTYCEHLFELREGRRVAPNLSYFSSPIILVEDLVTSIGEFPMNAYYQFTNDKDRIASRNGYGLSHVWLEADAQFKNLQCDRGDNSASNQFVVKDIILDKAHHSVIRLNRSVYNRTSLQHKLKSGVFVAATPFRYVFGSAWNGTIAGNAWKVMKRRARNMVDPTGDSDNRLQKRQLTSYKDGIGSSLGSFFESLFALKNRYPELDLQVNLIGHSMGTIAINNLLEKYRADWQASGILNNVVYMAAAASTQETLSIVPDLMKSDHAFDFFNITLNRVSEVAEFYALGFAPSGSLLVSIDKYHDKPEHHLKRTFGSEINVRSSLPAILKSFQGVKGKVVLKAFNDVESLETSTKIPVKHGDFGDLDFWLPSTWEITNDRYETPTPEQSYQCEPILKRPITADKTKALREVHQATDVLFKPK